VLYLLTYCSTFGLHDEQNAAGINTHIPATCCRLKEIEALLQHAAQSSPPLNLLESRSVATGWTALVRAAYKGQADMVALLIKYGANVNAVGKKDFTALIAASQVTTF
jgi:ankyrin repeat protein